MGSRSWMIILVIGALGVAALALVTKFALDSSGALRATAKFKADLVSTLSDRGVQSVSLRRVRRERKARLALVASADRIEGDERIHLDIARLFFRHFPRGIATLELVYSSPPRWWGCGASRPFLEREVSREALLAEEREARERDRITRWIDSRPGLRTLELRRDDAGFELRVQSDARRRDATHRPSAIAGSVARAVASFVRLAPGQHIAIELLDAGAEPSPTRSGPRGSSPAEAPSEPPAGRREAGVAHALEASRGRGASPSRVLGRWVHDSRGAPLPEPEASAATAGSIPRGSVGGR